MNWTMFWCPRPADNDGNVRWKDGIVSIHSSIGCSEVKFIFLSPDLDGCYIVLFLESLKINDENSTVEEV